MLLGLHILYLKRDITQFPRNAFANQIEVYCSKFFYGPLVVVFCDTKPPYKLHEFPPYYLIDEIEPLNEIEQRCYPLPFGKFTLSSSLCLFVMSYCCCSCMTLALYALLPRRQAVFASARPYERRPLHTEP